jgi:inner membrane protein
MPMLIIAANIPDIDAVATLLGGQQHLGIRRGITHGPMAMLILPIILWAVMLAYDKWRPNPQRLPVHRGWLLFLAYIGTLSHPLLDLTNNYGVRLLSPFSDQWFYGDTLFIIDIWIWIALIAAMVVSRRKEKRGQGLWTRPALAAAIAVPAYIAANFAFTTHVEASALSQIRDRFDRQPETVVASPVPLEFWRRRILWQDAQWRGYGAYNALADAPLTLAAPQKARHMDYPGLAGAQARDIDAAAFLFWSRMPYVEFEKGDFGPKIILRDMRFDERILGDRFSVEIEIKP